MALHPYEESALFLEEVADRTSGDTERSVRAAAANLRKARRELDDLCQRRAKVFGAWWQFWQAWGGRRKLSELAPEVDALREAIHAMDP